MRSIEMLFVIAALGGLFLMLVGVVLSLVGF